MTQRFGAGSCTASPPTFGPPQRRADHVATEVRFHSGCVTLAGTLYQPVEEGPHPAMVFLHGSGETPRLGFGGPWLTTPLVEADFTVVLSGSAVSVGEEIAYSRLTGGDNLLPPDADVDEVLRDVREAGPSGFDPRPLLRTYRVPGLWIYGARDGSQPTALDVEVLERIRTEHGRDFTIEVFPDLGHDTTHDPEALNSMVAWIERTVASL